MSTREIAQSIFEQLTEEQLKGFIALFSGVYHVSDSDNGQERREEAFRKLESMRRNIPDFDEEKALEEYREEKFGK